MITDKNPLLEYWSWLDSLDEDVQKVALTIWDETGRPTKPVIVGIVMLLDMTTTFPAFIEKYKTLFSHKDNCSLEDEGKLYYQLYIGGINRLKKALMDDINNDNLFGKKDGQKEKEAAV